MAAETVTVWNYPTAIHFGAGASLRLPALARQMGLRRPLVVTDRGLAAAAFVKALVARIRGAALFSAVDGNPVGRSVDDGVRALRAGGHDGVIALGGGSALDVGKMVALMAGQSAGLWQVGGAAADWSGIDPATIAPLIAVPTTAGTGSEVGRAAVITDEAAGRKRIVFHPRMLPPLVVLDPELTLSLPPDLTAATGLDAFVHAFEAYCAPGFHPMADGIALEAMRLVARALPRAYEKGDDLAARGDMLAAAAMGATAFQKGLGGVHALAHAIGALYDVHHGRINAVLLPYVMAANRDAIAPRLAAVAPVLGCEDAGEGYDAVLGWVLEIRRRLGIPPALAALGVGGERAADIARLAKEDPCDATNPAPLDEAAYRRIVLAAIHGEIGSQP